MTHFEDRFPWPTARYITSVRCRFNAYSAVQYNMILHASLQCLGQNMIKSLNAQMTPHNSPYPASYGVLCADLGENVPRYNGTKLYIHFDAIFEESLNF